MSSHSKTRFGDRIRLIRQKRKLSLRKVAAEAGISTVGITINEKAGDAWDMIK